MSDNKLYVHVLLDRSGSMESCRDDTIKAFNDYVASLKEAWRTPARLSLTTFDSEGIDLVHDALPVAGLPELTRAQFVPRASTPLMDAIGQTVAQIDKAALLPGERVVLVILTDGLENASREYDKASVGKLLDGRQEDMHWLVLYLGANQDAWAEGEQFGTHAGASLSFSSGRVQRVMAAAARSSLSYARACGIDAARKDAAFTEAERTESMDRPEGHKPGKPKA